MFTGIVQCICPIQYVKKSPGLTHYAVKFTHKLMPNLQKGASISIDGVCQTIVSFESLSSTNEHLVWFDAIEETLQRTTLKFLKENQLVNVERSARLGDEIGGHLLSGHIYGTVSIAKIEKLPNNHIITFQCPSSWTKYLFPKGYTALNGVSLTLVDVNPKGFFTVHLIPETLAQTTFNQKSTGDLINLELDSQTQTIVDTIERFLATSKVN